MHDIGGRTVRKVRNRDLGVVARLSPDIVILEIGTNDLSLLPPEVVGSEIEELVSLLRQTYHVKVVCVCLLTPRNRNPVFNTKRVIVNKYLTVVLEHMPNVFTWLHRGFARPSVTPFLRDDLVTTLVSSVTATVTQQLSALLPSPLTALPGISPRSLLLGMRFQARLF